RRRNLWRGAQSDRRGLCRTGRFRLRLAALFPRRAPRGDAGRALAASSHEAGHHGAVARGDRVMADMAAVLDGLAPGRPDGLHAGAAAGEYPGIEDFVVALADEGDMIRVQRDEIGPAARRDRAAVAGERLGSSF